MKLLKMDELTQISGGYETTSVGMAFNIPLSVAPILAEGFPFLFDKNYNDLAAFVDALAATGIDPSQIQVEVDIYRSESIGF